MIIDTVIMEASVEEQVDDSQQSMEMSIKNRHYVGMEGNEETPPRRPREAYNTLVMVGGRNSFVNDGTTEQQAENAYAQLNESK